MEKVKKQEPESLFVGYNEALALKELGFDEPCLAYFDAEKVFKFPGTTMCNRNFLDLLTVTAPLKQQVFRWFRDKYNIHAEITWDPSYEYDPGKWSDAIYEITFVDVSYTKEWKAESPNMQRSEGKQLTYEEAEQACLDKLIEIIKQIIL